MDPASIITIITNLGTFAIGSGAVVWLVKLLAPHFLSLNLERYRAELKASTDRDLEGYKAELKVRHEVEIERLRADIRQIAFQRETTFAKLHEKRAAVIAEIYAKLARVHIAMSHLVAVLPIADVSNKDETEAEALRAGQDFSEYLNRNLIYFDKSLSNLLTSFDEKMVEAFNTHRNTPMAKTDRLKSWLTIQTILELESKKIREEIEHNFRQLLGLTSQESEQKGMSSKGQG